ncbi:MAG: DNA topoisomerase IV subunit A [Sphaerochaetaceae bacterium]|jgi:topoisomerase-4 subunit A|nr:DNA topoisomerase IV subunit A [Sphaerochaetaceae bacterium]MDD3163740.1 DNA topoisomerase IV subunit A [Sphaerochaetaceae bacterium]MDD4007489.1 DNA topoisomerase IV subunit A [Sphaerochaetaceae bacterium]MDD4396466.1 DNA topoisomerase IV subunit A [Sphaerochaetaceae bacterium]
MPYAETLYKKNYIEYASYVIKDRAIPEINDGFKPVQRRIIHTLLEMDDGRFHKVANVVGFCMRYHPHGDASIYGALVNLANCDLLIDKQGNFGNWMTGDGPAAPRYIECRINPIAKKILYNPEITEFVDSYDGRNQEPVTFPSKIPLVLIQGSSGIAPGMITEIFPHNALEVLSAQEADLRGESFQLYPDFPSGGIIDVSDYKDGNGTVVCRAKLDTSDPKKIVIYELPYGMDSEKMIDSIEDAVKKGKLKINSINDFTSSSVNIEISLAKGTYSKDVIDALYAYTKCEMKLQASCLVIQDRLPVLTNVSDIIHYHSKHLVDVLHKELELEIGHLEDRLQARTLERIFVEERIYKRIEQKRSPEAIATAVKTGFEPFSAELFRPISDDDVDHLLKLPIRRISLFDIEKNHQEIDEINSGIAAAKDHLAHIVEYAISYLEDLKKNDMSGERFERKTQVKSFDIVNAKEIAQRDQNLRYDSDTGYIGYGLRTGNIIMQVSVYDKILMIHKTGTYSYVTAPEKLFIGKEMMICSLADREDDTVYTVIFQGKKSKKIFINRIVLGGFILNKAYSFVPPDSDKDQFVCKKISTLPNAKLAITYKPGRGYKKLEDQYYFSDFAVHRHGLTGVTLTDKEISSIKITPVKDVEVETEPSLFDVDSKEGKDE